MSSVINEISTSGGNLVVSHQFSADTQIEMADTDYHLIGCLLNGLHKHKVSRIGDQEHVGGSSARRPFYQACFLFRVLVVERSR